MAEVVPKWAPGQSVILESVEDQQMLAEGQPLPSDGPQDKWFGFYGDTLRVASVRAIPTPPIDSTTFPATFGLHVTPSHPSVLVRNIPGLKPGKIKDIFPDGVPALEAEKSLGLSLENRNYSLTLTSTNKDTMGYRVVLRQGSIEQVLYSETEADEPLFFLVWAGDLNGDGELDLITNFSPKYSMFKYVVWLSGRTSKQDTPLLRPVATYLGYGC